MKTLVGVISDTHGLLRPEAVDALKGVEHILHAGDIGKPEVLEGLRSIAPVTAIRGNNDRDAWADEVPDQITVSIADVSVHLIHILKQLTLDPAEQGIRVVISGHSHKPLLEERAGVLWLNPGSAGPRRFKLPISLALLEIEKANVNATLVELSV